MSGLKVMIFESDRTFADALKRAFTRRGCTVRVVDDGQLGLDLAPTDPPDLIIVAVELPRMSGFAVCNKLKKINELKDIPVVITSSESSQETFDHHSKLRTRAEDYVHKPIGPEELIRRCAAHVQLPDVPAPDSEEVSIDDLEAVPINDDPISEPSQFPPARDVELDNIAEAAFDHIMIPSDAPGQAAPVPVKVLTPPAVTAPQTPSAPPPSRLAAIVDDDLDDLTMVSNNRSMSDMQLAMRASAAPRAPSGGSPRAPTPQPFPAPPAPRAPTPQPGPSPLASTPSPVQAAETERLRKRVDELEQELAGARGVARKVEELTEETARLRTLADESQRLSRELDELRARTTKAAPPGAREALDLRESLHKKDKEILHLRELANARDKELLALRETLLQRDLEKADLDERILEQAHELADQSDRVAALVQELETLRSRHDEATRDLTATRASGDALEKALASARKLASDTEGALRGELAAERDGRKRDNDKAREDKAAAEKSHADALDVAKAALVAETALLIGEKSARAEEVKALRDANERALAALRDEHAGAMSAKQSEHEKALAALRDEHASETAELTAKHEKQTAESDAAHSAAVAALGEELEGERSARADEVKKLRETHALAIARADNERRTLRSELEAHIVTLTGDRDQATQRGEQLSRDLSRTRAELEHAGRVSARNAVLMERARRAMLIAAGLVDETGSALEEGTSEGATTVGNAE